MDVQLAPNENRLNATADVTFTPLEDTRAVTFELNGSLKVESVSLQNLSTPVMCRIRQRLTAHGGETFDAPSEWMRWHSTDSQDKREQAESPYLKPSSDKKT